jgi:hypothetical protein
LQLCSKFLGSNDEVLIIINLSMRVEEDSSSLELFLQKTDLKEYMLKPKLRIKVQKVEGEAPTPQVLM